MKKLSHNIIIRYIKSFLVSIKDLIKHDGIEHAGYLSFITILAFFPFLIILISIAGELSELPIVDNFISALLNNLPHNVTQLLSPRISEIINGPSPGIMTVAVLGALWTASSFIEGIRTILNRAYRVSSPPPYIWRRLLSMAQFIFITVSLILILMILLLLPPFMHKIMEFTSLHFEWHLLSLLQVKILNRILLFFVLFVFVICLNYFITNLKLSFVQLIPGTILTTSGWLLTASLLTNYMGHFQQVSVIYGSLKNIIITLLFFYLINLIFIFGAEFNYNLRSKKSGK